MIKFRTRHLAVVLSIAAVVAAGCGSSSSSKSGAKSPAASTPATPSTPTGTTTTPTSGFAAELNAICKQGNAETTSDLPAAATLVETKYLPKFEALTPPAAQKADYEQFISIVKQQVAAAKKSDEATFKSLDAKGNALGAKLGAPECAKSS